MQLNLPDEPTVYATFRPTFSKAIRSGIARSSDHAVLWEGLWSVMASFAIGSIANDVATLNFGALGVMVVLVRFSKPRAG